MTVVLTNRKCCSPFSNQPEVSQCVCMHTRPLTTKRCFTFTSHSGLRVDTGQLVVSQLVVSQHGVGGARSRRNSTQFSLKEINHFGDMGFFGFWHYRCARPVVVQSPHPEATLQTSVTTWKTTTSTYTTRVWSRHVKVKVVALMMFLPRLVNRKL